MHNRNYDYLFVTVLPSFYKINLYNAIAKHCKIFVIFIAMSAQERAADFNGKDYQFDYCILNKTAIENRSRIKSVYGLVKQLLLLNYKKCVVGGWDYLEFWVMILLSPKAKNGLILESSIFESAHNGIKGWIKKLFLSNINVVFSSGEPHHALLYALNFMGRIKKTLGVGIANYCKKMITQKQFMGKFLYVGRLSSEKNLEFLVKAFNQLPDFTLTIIGEGKQLTALQKFASFNIALIGYVPNKALAPWYQEHDVLILPSLSETWGLVVEEALYYGLPVVVSYRIGCAKDLVEKNGVGTLFDPLSIPSFNAALQKMVTHYDQYCAKVKEINFNARDQWQVQQYVQDVL